MTGKTLWQSLKSLVELDKQVSNIEQEIEFAKKGIETENQTLLKLQQSMELAEKSYHADRKDSDFAELNVKDLRDKEVAKRNQLDSIQNPKEYRAFEKEVETLARRLADMEASLEKAWSKLEKSEKSFKQAQEDHKVKTEQMVVDLQAKQEIINEQIAKIETLCQPRAEILKVIPADWQLKYERMRKSVADPVVPAVQGSCSVCFYSIPRQDMIKLNNHGVLLCRNCYRFLICEEK